MESASGPETEPQATVEQKPPQTTIVLRSSILKDDLSKLSRGEEVLATTLQIPPEERPQCCDDLFLATWELKWEQTMFLVSNVITLSLKLIPSPEFGDKLSSVRIDHNTGYLDPGSDMELTSECRKDVLLKRQYDYKCNILSEWTEMKLNDYVDSEGITVESHITIQHATFDVIQEVNVPSCTTLCDLGSLLVFSEEQSLEKFCDVTLTATLPQSQEDTDSLAHAKFFAHKAILAVRSPVFVKMLLHNMQESITNTINLPDIEPDALKELLIYIYTCESPNIKEHAISLLYQAEKYQLGHLKALCERCLSYSLQVENVARMLILADACNAEQLKRNALLYISVHGDRVKLTEEWEDLKKDANLMDNLLDVVFEPEVKFKRRRLI